MVAPFFVGHPVNELIFRSYAKRCLAPTLTIGGIVIMDNTGGHQSQAVRNAITAQVAGLPFLPPRSPELRAFEKAVAITTQFATNNSPLTASVWNAAA